MKCAKCGTEFDSNFCPNCGAPASDSPDSGTKQPAKEGFWKRFAEQANEINRQKQENKPISKRERITENRKNGIACCPKCGSTSITANKKGFGIGKAVVGAWAAGPIGLAAGNIGARKVWVTCLNCGHRWKI